MPAGLIHERPTGKQGMRPNTKGGNQRGDPLSFPPGIAADSPELPSKTRALQGSAFMPPPFHSPKFGAPRGPPAPWRRIRASLAPQHS